MGKKVNEEDGRGRERMREEMKRIKEDMGRPKGSKNGRRKERKERQLAEMRKTPIDALTTPLEPEEGLVCLGDACFCHRMKHENSGAENRCAYRKKGGKCDALF